MHFNISVKKILVFHRQNKPSSHIFKQIFYFKLTLITVFMDS
ncbi:hypothetical protein Gogos_020924, partial [Gossypium gossypioides]|nr:hypothetical protein [Gossypium gossypioides]